MSRAEVIAWWDKIARAADALSDEPQWKHAGISLNPQHFETYDQWCGHVAEPMRIGATEAEHDG